MKGVTSNKGFGEIIVSAIFLSFGVLLLVASTKQPDFGISRQSPGIFPASVAVIMILASISQLIKVVTGHPQENDGLNNAEHGEQMKQADSSKWRLALYLMVIVGYILLLGHLNFLVATFMFLAVSMLLLDAGSLPKIFALSALSALAFRLVFETIFKVILP